MDWPPVFARIAEELARLVPPPPPEPILVELTAGELLDRIAFLEAEIEADAASADAPGRLASLEAARSRLLRARPASAATLSELRTLHRSLQRADRDLRAFERDEDFGPRFIVLAQLMSHQRGRRAELIRQIDSDQTGR